MVLIISSPYSLDGQKELWEFHGAKQYFLACLIRLLGHIPQFILPTTLGWVYGWLLVGSQHT
jgi:hypothetical protein